MSLLVLENGIVLNLLQIQIIPDPDLVGKQDPGVFLPINPQGDHQPGKGVLHFQTIVRKLMPILLFRLMADYLMNQLEFVLALQDINGILIAVQTQISQKKDNRTKEV